jgi:hypothetical protein
MRYCKQKEITGRTLTIDNLPKLKILDIYRTNRTTQKYAEINFGVTKDSKNVNLQVVRTRYARTAKCATNYRNLTRKN